MADARAGVVADGRCFALSCEPNLMVMRLFGEIDDRQSRAWRERLTAEMRLRGSPRFVAFDMLEAQPKNSMVTRFEVAAYCRDLMQRVEWATLLMPVSVGAAVVVRLVMGIVATPRLNVVVTRGAFEGALEQMRKGDRPKV